MALNSPTRESVELVMDLTIELQRAEALYVNLFCQKERTELAKWEEYMPRTRMPKFAEREHVRFQAALAKAEAQARANFHAVIRGEVEP